MEQHKSSITAQVSAFARAYHAKNDHPVIFNDELAFALLGEEQYNQIVNYMLAGLPFFSAGESITLDSDAEALKWIVQTNLAPTPIARARYCEDMLKNAIRLGVKQYVILGAGLDTFAFRNPDLLNRISVFELDHPATQADKLERIRNLGWIVPQNYHLIPMDFTSQSLPEVLSPSCFDPNQRTFFSWLGVTYYLAEQTIAAMLTAIASIAPKGSTLMFDCFNETLFDCKVKRVQSMLAMAEASGEPMKSSFSYTALELLLGKTGYLIYEYLSSAEIESRYFLNRQDYLHAFETDQYVLAVVQ
jgi:methyltransferase (TIGR00027 family)